MALNIIHKNNIRNICDLVSKNGLLYTHTLLTFLDSHKFETDYKHKARAAQK